jgi:hypothetical protein
MAQRTNKTRPVLRGPAGRAPPTARVASRCRRPVVVPGPAQSCDAHSQCSGCNESSKLHFPRRLALLRLSGLVPDVCPGRGLVTNELDFPHLGGVREQTSEMVHECAGHFHAVACVRQPAECGMHPEMAPDQCQSISEGRGRLGVPGGLADRGGGPGQRSVCLEGHQGEQAQQGRRGPQDGTLRPLALGLDAQMGAHFVERHFDLPATDEPGEDLLRISVEIGAQQRLGAESAARVTGSG